MPVTPNTAHGFVQTLFWLGNNARDRQTNRKTYVGDSIIPAKRSFRGDKNAPHTCACAFEEQTQLYGFHHIWNTNNDAASTNASNIVTHS